MDIFTLMICTGLVSFFMFFATFLLYLTSKSETYLLDWSFAGIAFLISNLTGIIGKFSELPFILHPILPNTFYILGHFAILTGIIKLTTGDSHIRKLSYIGLFVIIIHFFEFTQSSVENRLLIFYSVILVACFGTMFVAWKGRCLSIGKALWLILIVESLFALQLILRGGYMIFDGSPLQLFGSEFMQTSGSLFLLIFLFLNTLCFVFLVSWKKELKLRSHSRTDYLTGWLNRRALVETGLNVFERCKREQNHFGVIIFDIDHFKKVNDTFGHSAGDEAIKHICSIANKSKRSYDFHFRLGGEEFAILVHNSDMEDIKKLSERIRSCIESTPLKWEDHTITITVSVGASISRENDNNWEQVLERADKALYLAKSEGRNLVKIAKDYEIKSTEIQDSESIFNRAVID